MSMRDREDREPPATGWVGAAAAIDEIAMLDDACRLR